MIFRVSQEVCDRLPFIQKYLTKREEFFPVVEVSEDAVYSKMMQKKIGTRKDTNLSDEIDRSRKEAKTFYTKQEIDYLTTEINQASLGDKFNFQKHHHDELINEIMSALLYLRYNAFI